LLQQSCQAGWLIIWMIPATCYYFEAFFPTMPRPGKSSLSAGYVSPWGPPPGRSYLDFTGSQWGARPQKISKHRQ
jgi:hypothetical protein